MVFIILQYTRDPALVNSGRQNINSNDSYREWFFFFKLLFKIYLSFFIQTPILADPTLTSLSSVSATLLIVTPTYTPYNINQSHYKIYLK